MFLLLFGKQILLLLLGRKGGEPYISHLKKKKQTTKRANKKFIKKKKGFYESFFSCMDTALFVWRGMGTKRRGKQAAQVYFVEKIHNLQRGSETLD